ncbi:MAG: Crp/Fnr family transcriptional regulator [Rhodoblastus sp.]
MTLDDWSALLRSPFFKAVDPRVLRSIAERHPPRAFERGETLFQQGDPAAACYAILEGRLKLYRPRVDGDQAVVSILDAGDIYFEPSMFSGGRCRVSGETTSSARIMQIGACALRIAIEKQPQVAFGMFSCTAQHIDRLVDQVETLKVLTASQRVADFLRRRIEAVIGTAMIKLPYEKSLVASHLGMTPESFSRALADLRKIGVAVERDHIQIEAVERLAHFVGYAPIH